MKTNNNTMQAVVYNQFGGPEVLHVSDVDKPVPKNNEILIKVVATTVNFGDSLARNFRKVSPFKFSMPLLLWLPVRISFGIRKPRKKILGNLFAGVIKSAGTQTTRFKEGDQVFGYLGQGMGAYAEYISMPEDGIVAHKPTTMSFEEATILPYGIMALNLLKKGNIKSGDKVLINGASGGIGSIAVQLAKSLGAEVTGVCGTPRLDFVKELGADTVIDYTKEDFTENGATYDLIFDVLGKSSYSKAKNSLNKDGCYLLASFGLKHLVLMLRTKLIGDKKVICALAPEKTEDLIHIKDLAEQGTIKAIIDKSFPFEQTAEAHAYYESGQKKGNVVITLDHLM